MKLYENKNGAPIRPKFGDLRRWRKERRSKTKDLSFRVPRTEFDRTAWEAEAPPAKLVWIGHSTFLLRLGGLSVLTDPVWADRMAFEKRLTPPGIALDRLPPIDVVLLSHGHYDHLDFPTLRRLPGDPLHLVPEGLAGLFRRKGFNRVRELAWWESERTSGLTFTFVPAQHWTRRSPWDMNRSHWGGWIVEGEEEAADVPTVYFAGDSGYFDGFAEIGGTFPRIDVALMPIGAYEPEWFMSPQHVTPEEAVQAFRDVGAATFVPMHYGAFRLADDTPKEALDRLYAAWSASGLAAERLVVPMLGETVPLLRGSVPTDGAVSPPAPVLTQRSGR
ncbi:MBL fold metallo-hydrolase [Paenibacillus flagellatus]|uniref:MBL fold metallo-hydrolase n=1 Tax=Paenibacillus flagellatus TaxID=2211139 RepID=A0A2V5K8J8_9BACL|nr:MBL fold metallo-hydrolase [Paenibacillus flagellatus]PYI55829.1 MBL fold metallo-hydrolase [Paenibacillus flagellatus]